MECVYVFAQRTILQLLLTLYTNICKRILQTAPPAVPLASKLKPFWLLTLLIWPVTFLHVSRRATGQPCHGIPSCQFAGPFTLDLGTGQIDGQTDNSHQCIMPHAMGAGHNDICDKSWSTMMTENYIWSTPRHEECRQARAVIRHCMYKRTEWTCCELRTSELPTCIVSAAGVDHRRSQD